MFGRKYDSIFGCVKFDESKERITFHSIYCGGRQWCMVCECSFCEYRKFLEFGIEYGLIKEEE